MEALIGIIFVVLIVARALLGKDDSGASGPPWTQR